MLLILDTSCISAFIRAGAVGLLLKITEKAKVAITQEVLHELKLSKNPKIKNFAHPGVSVEKAEGSIEEKYGIHSGESSVILLAKAKNAIAVIDDKRGRESAKKEGARVYGTAAILKIGLKRGIITKEEAIKIIDEGGLHLSEEMKKWLGG